MKKYLITSYQIIYPNGIRDNVKPISPIWDDDIAKIREKLRVHYGAQAINLTYSEFE